MGVTGGPAETRRLPGRLGARGRRSRRCFSGAGRGGRAVRVRFPGRRDFEGAAPRGARAWGRRGERRSRRARSAWGRIVWAGGSDQPVDGLVAGGSVDAEGGAGGGHLVLLGGRDGVVLARKT